MMKYKTAALAASIALALGTTAAYAAPPAAPAANQLPGQGSVTQGAATATVTPGTTTAPMTMAIAVTGNTVIDWGNAKATTIDLNPSGTAGFNIGSDAAVTFSATAAAGVLNVDMSGNASQIFGGLTGGANISGLFVANANGIIVGPKATITAVTTAPVGLIGNTTTVGTFDGTADTGSIDYDTTGGDVTVSPGASITGKTLLVSGGGVVNVDVGAVTAASGITVQAGQSTAGITKPSTPSATAGIAISGVNTTDALTLQSSGDASVGAGSVALSGGDVAGTFTNGGIVSTTGTTAVYTAGKYTSGFNAIVNNGSFTSTGVVNVGSLTNNGEFAAGTNDVNVVAGDFVNGGGNAAVTAGAVTVAAGNLTNQGAFKSGAVAITGGNLVNSGQLDATNGTAGGTDVLVTDGTVTNNTGATLTLGNGNITTVGDANGTAGAGYYITNSGTLTNGGTGGLTINTNELGSTLTPASNGSFVNTGTLNVGATGADLTITANNGVNLGGTLQASTGTNPDGSPMWTAIGAKNALGVVNLMANNGTLNVGTAIVSGAANPVGTAAVQLTGNQVAVRADVSAIHATASVPDASVGIWAGDAPAASAADPYAVRVAGGVTVSGANVWIAPQATGDAPNAILQGWLDGGDVNFTGSNLFGGANGGIQAATLELNFSGAVKTVPYNNDPNFVYNGLQVVDTNVDTSGNALPLGLTLNPATGVKGTVPGGSAVNILVTGGVNLTSVVAPVTIPAPTATTVATTNTVPNTHLVLQSTGSIATTGAFYWPGTVYLGTIDSSTDADGNVTAMPGTLGAGVITLGGAFSNVLVGDISGASGIHFETQWPLQGNFAVSTNAMALINFGSQSLVDGYTNGALTGQTFNGGAVQTVGQLQTVTYDTLSNLQKLKGATGVTTFNLHVPNSNK